VPVSSPTSRVSSNEKTVGHGLFDVTFGDLLIVDRQDPLAALAPTAAVVREFEPA